MEKLNLVLITFPTKSIYCCKLVVCKLTVSSGKCYHKPDRYVHIHLNQQMLFHMCSSSFFLSKCLVMFPLPQKQDISKIYLQYFVFIIHLLTHFNSFGGLMALQRTWAGGQMFCANDNIMLTVSRFLVTERFGILKLVLIPIPNPICVHFLSKHKYFFYCFTAYRELLQYYATAHRHQSSSHLHQIFVRGE